MATHSLRRMAAGGMHDHLGGGFHRYSGAWDARARPSCLLPALLPAAVLPALLLLRVCPMRAHTRRCFLLLQWTSTGMSLTSKS